MKNKILVTGGTGLIGKYLQKEMPNAIYVGSSDYNLTKNDEVINKEQLGIKQGSIVRVIRAPFFGKIGEVLELPAELQKMESETMVRVAKVRIDNEASVIPRSNLELLETD